MFPLYNIQQIKFSERNEICWRQFDYLLYPEVIYNNILTSIKPNFARNTDIKIK